MSVQHAVLFHFREELSPEDEAEMFARVRSFPDEIGGFEVLRLGKPLDTARTRDYQYLLHMVVADEAALARYQDHPCHVAFANWVVDHGGTVLAFDYHLDGHTVIPTGER